jgi:lysophospholipase L1-like esterase
MRVLVFGDSIAQGFFDSRGGWVQRLASECHMKTIAAMNTGGDYYVEVHNLGVSGDAAEGVLHRMEPEMEARRLYEEEEVILLAVGTNDAVLRQNIALQDVYEFQKIYEEIVDIARRTSHKVLCIGLPAVNEALSDPWKFSDTGRQYKNNRLNLFEDTVKQVAEQKDVAFVPIFDNFLAALQAGQELLADGLHPNDAGHELMYQIIKPALEELMV